MSYNNSNMDSYIYHQTPGESDSYYYDVSPIEATFPQPSQGSHFYEHLSPIEENFPRQEHRTRAPAYFDESEPRLFFDITPNESVHSQRHQDFVENQSQRPTPSRPKLQRSRNMDYSPATSPVAGFSYTSTLTGEDVPYHSTSRRRETDFSDFLPTEQMPHLRDWEKAQEMQHQRKQIRAKAKRAGQKMVGRGKGEKTREDKTVEKKPKLKRLATWINEGLNRSNKKRKMTV